jgi:hypothetical protein
MDRLKNPDAVVKCGCGLSMRRRQWAAHWNGCKVGSSVEVTSVDVSALEDHEKYMLEHHGIDKRNIS